MRSRAWLWAAILGAVAFGALGVTSVAKAAPAANQVCPSFTKAGVKYNWEVVGNVTCSQGKTWLLKLIAAHLSGQGYVKAKIPGAPKGFHCFSGYLKNGHAQHGACYTGTFAYPGNGLLW